MRIAVLILGLLLGLLMFFQTVLAYALSSAVAADETTAASAVGMFMALLWLVSCAFVMPWPMVSVVAFAVAGLLGFAASGEFPDLAIWGGASLVLMLMSFFGWRGKRRDRKAAQVELERQRERDERLEQLLQQQLPR